MQNQHIAFVHVPQPSPSGMRDRIYGLTVLERTLHALERGGVGEVYLPQALKDAHSLHNEWKLRLCFTDDFASQMRASDGALVLSEPLVLDPRCVQLLLEKAAGSGGSVFAKNGGMAWHPKEVLAAAGGSAATFDGLRQWAEAHGTAIETIDFQGLVCSSVRTPAERRAVERALIRSLTKPTDGWVSRHLNRPISTAISRVLAHTGITPNQFTIVTGLIGLSVAYFLAKGGYWNYLIGGALFHLTSVLDGVDGELARLKFKSSPFGQWLDTLVDNLSYLAALGGIIAGIYLHGAPGHILWAGGLSVLFAVLALGSLYSYLLRFKSGGTLLNVKYGFQEGNSTFSRVMQVAAAFGKRDLFALIFFLLGIAGIMQWALWYIAIMAFMVFAFSVQEHIAAAKPKN